MWITYFFALLASLANAQEFKRSEITDKFWIEASAALSPDSGIFHAEGSAVADRRDIAFRYQYDILGVVVNWHRGVLNTEKDQEAFDLENQIFGLGFTLRYSPFGDKGGILGSSHLVAHFMGQMGRSDYHYFEGPVGNKTEAAAGIAHATGFSAGADFYFPAYFGLWLHGGGGWETNSFSYKITSDPNGDGKVNIYQTFTYVRLGLSFSI